MYFAITQGTPAPTEMLVWNMAERFGWTLDYIDSLPIAKIHEFVQIEDGRAKARTSIIKR